MKRLSALVLGLLVLALLAFTTRTALAQATAYVVVDDASGTVLIGSEANKKLQIASLTKIATAMVVLDWAAAQNQDLSQLATFSPAAAAQNTPGGVGFQAGERCSLRDLIYAALMQSDNSAAYALAEHVGAQLGGEAPVPAFVDQMNALAHQLKMNRTRFSNPTGQDEGVKPVPFSTAGDLALLTRYAMGQSAFRFHVSQKERKIAVTRADGTAGGYMLRNTNELLGVDGIDGVKTGTTRRAGACLILSSGRPPESRQEGEKHYITPRRLTVVILASGDRFGMGRGLMQRGWAEHEAWVAAGRPKEWKGR